MDALVLYEFQQLRENKGHKMRQKIMQGDLQGAILELGGELALEELERHIRNARETEARIRLDLEQRKQHRSRKRAAAATEPAGESAPPVPINRSAAG